MTVLAVLLSLLLPSDPAPAPAAPPSAVTCELPDDPQARVYRLERSGEGWRLAFRSRATGDRSIHLPLPSARPAVADGTLTVSYRNANGGRQVDLTVRDGGSSLDVWVDYGLEVNIEPDLDPQVDLLNTDGSVAVVCDITP